MLRITIVPPLATAIFPTAGCVRSDFVPRPHCRRALVRLRRVRLLSPGLVECVNAPWRRGRVRPVLGPPPRLKRMSEGLTSGHNPAGGTPWPVEAERLCGPQRCRDETTAPWAASCMRCGRGGTVGPGDRSLGVSLDERGRARAVKVANQLCTPCSLRCAATDAMPGLREGWQIRVVLGPRLPVQRFRGAPTRVLNGGLMRRRSQRLSAIYPRGPSIG